MNQEKNNNPILFKNDIKNIYNYFFYWLLLFALTITLSKSINTIVMVLIYTQVIILCFLKFEFRHKIFSHMKQPLIIPFLLFLGISIFGILYSQDAIEGIKRTKTLINLPLIYIMITTLLDINKNHLLKKGKILLLTFLIGLFILDTIGFLNYLGLIGNRPHILPLHPLNIHHIWFGNLNAIGFYVALFLLVFLYTYLKKVNLFFLILSIPYFTIAMIMSISRTSWLGFIGTFFIITLLLFKKNKKLLLPLISIILLVSISLFYFNDTIHHRINLIFSDIEKYKSGIINTSIGSRFIMWKVAFKMFLSNPILGIGTGDYIIKTKEYTQSLKFPSFITQYNHPHNVYLFIMATLGLIGLASFFYIFFKILVYSKRLIHSKNNFYGYIALAVTSHIMISSLTECIIYIHILLVTFAFIIGITIRLSTITLKS